MTSSAENKVTLPLCVLLSELLCVDSWSYCRTCVGVPYAAVSDAEGRDIISSKTPLSAKISLKKVPFAQPSVFIKQPMYPILMLQISLPEIVTEEKNVFSILLPM